MPWGPKWLDTIFHGIRTKEGEWKFVFRFLRSGMTFFDAGANQGFYTLLAAKRLGASGSVYAFEPAPGECQKLRRNVRFNGYRNVLIVPQALGDQEGMAQFYWFLGHEGSFSSLREPATDVTSRRQLITVPITTLDRYIERNGIRALDMLKIDVEGGELSVLRGGSNTLRQFQPVVLCEVEDRRTRQWEYVSGEILNLLEGHGYVWFSAQRDGRLEKYEVACKYLRHNLVAVPEEKLSWIQSLTENPC